MIYWLVVWLPFFYFPIQLGIIIIPIDFHIFSEGWPNHQPVYKGLDSELDPDSQHRHIDIVYISSRRGLDGSKKGGLLSMKIK